jgi:hypothetical protein
VVRLGSLLPFAAMFTNDRCGPFVSFDTKG